MKLSAAEALRFNMANFAHLQRTQQSATLSFKKTGGSASRPLRRRSALFEKWEEKLQAKPEVEVTRRGVVPTRYGEYATPLISPSNATATPAEKFDGFGKLSAGVSTTPEDTFTAAKQPERESRLMDLGASLSKQATRLQQSCWK